ncbi:TPA: hypothetical protein ACKQGR_005970 [Pseudomonas aeruginosa]|nr:hypothetical protein [Pseudomonas aeruginosa]
MNKAQTMGYRYYIFLAAYTAVNVKSCCQVLASIFLAAYTAVNVLR